MKKQLLAGVVIMSLIGVAAALPALADDNQTGDAAAPTMVGASVSVLHEQDMGDSSQQGGDGQVQDQVQSDVRTQVEVQH